MSDINFETYILESDKYVKEIKGKIKGMHMDEKDHAILKTEVANVISQNEAEMSY